MSDKKKPLSKPELIKVITEASDYETNVESEKAINAVVAGIKKALANGDDVSLIGFGVFKVSHRPEREGRNPSTGEPLTIKAGNTVGFKSGKDLKLAVNQ
jgi:nucleoid DNA-binding protein